MRRGPWDGVGRRGLGRQAVNAPQQAKGQLSSENDSVGRSSRISVGNTQDSLKVTMWQMLARIYRHSDTA